MPTKTFLNLPYEKQKNLIDASEREFSKVLYEDASINQIIQDAKISRGSFYTYFNDKEDLYFYILKRYTDQLFCKLLEVIDRNDGDFTRAWEELHHAIVDEYLKEEKSPLFKKMFLNMQYKTDKKIGMKPPKDVIRKSHQEILEHIDYSLYNYQEDEEILDSFSLVMLITISSIVYILINPEEEENEKENYRRRLEIVRYGMIRREK